MVRSILGTLATIIVVIGIIAMIISILIPATCTSRERANRVKCASNLRQIGQGLLLYANDYGSYPRTRYDPTKDPTCFTPAAGPGGTTPNESDPFFGPNRPADNDVTAALFLLVRNDVAPDVFICPSTGQEKDTLNNVGALQRVNFSSPNNLSYSFANPYPKTQAVRLGYQYGPLGNATFAIAADRNDGNLDGNLTATSTSLSTAIRRDLNSRNHNQDGQNVLYSDGHVDWCATSWAGDGNDCIWGAALLTGAAPSSTQPAAARTTNGTDPRFPLDSILLPKKGQGF